MANRRRRVAGHGPAVGAFTVIVVLARSFLGSSMGRGEDFRPIVVDVPGDGASDDARDPSAVRFLAMLARFGRS